MSVDNTYTTELDPFVLSYDEGRVNILISNPRKLVGAAAIAAGAAFMLSGANTAHADQADGAPVTTLDTPEHVQIDRGSSVFAELRAQGYTVGEIAREMERKGIPQNMWAHFKVPAGSSWDVDPITVYERSSRLGENNKPNTPASTPPELIPTPMVLTLDHAGDTLIGLLKENGSDNPLADAKTVLAANSMTPEQARHLLIGRGFVIPDSVVRRFKTPATIPEQANAVPAPKATPPAPVETTPTPEVTPAVTEISSQFQTEVLPADQSQPQDVKIVGDSLTVGMHSLGNIDSQGQTIGLNISSEDAVQGRSLTEALTAPINFDDILSRDVLVLELGTNAKESDAVFEQNLWAYVQQIQQEASKKGVKVPTIFIVNQYEAGDKNVVRDETRNPLIDQLVQELGLKKIDWASYAAAHPELYAGGDGIHPTDFAAMAKFVDDEILRQTTPDVPSVVEPPTPVDTPAAPPEAPPTTEAPVVTEVPPTTAAQEPAATTTEVVAPPSTPEIERTAQENIVKFVRDAVFKNSGMLDQDSSAKALNYIMQLPHPEKSGDYPNPEAFFAIPASTLDFPWVAADRTCTAELYAKPSQVLSTITDVVIYEYLLSLPENAQYRNTIMVLSDRASGDHNTHGHGNMGDNITRVYTEDRAGLFDGPVFNMSSPIYNPDLTARFIALQGMAMNPNGHYLYSRIVFSDKHVNKMANDIAHTMGRQGIIAIYNTGHTGHEHTIAQINTLSQNKDNEQTDGILGTPNTPDPMRATNSCQLPSTDMDQPTRDALTARRATYPTADNPNPTAPVPEPAPPTTEAPVIDPPTTTTTPPVEVPPTLLVTDAPVPPTPVVIHPAVVDTANAFVMSADDYINTYNGGEHTEVKLRNNPNAVVAPADVQRMVDYVWRVEGGVAPQVVKDALMVGLAESGLNNSAMNKSTGDRCVFQINKVNKGFIKQLNQKYGWNIQYENLQNDLEGCVRVAFELYKQSVGNVYTPEYINKWISNYGLKLPDDLMNQVMNGKASDGWTAWLMSARNTGLL